MWASRGLSVYANKLSQSVSTDTNNFTLHGDVVTYAHGTVCTESSGTDRDKLSDTSKSIYTTPTSRWGPPSRASDSPTVLTPPGFVTRVTQGKPLISNRRNALHCAQKSPRLPPSKLRQRSRRRKASAAALQQRSSVGTLLVDVNRRRDRSGVMTLLLLGPTSSTPST